MESTNFTLKKELHKRPKPYSMTTIDYLPTNVLKSDFISLGLVRILSEKLLMPLVSDFPSLILIKNVCQGCMW